MNDSIENLTAKEAALTAELLDVRRALAAARGIPLSTAELKSNRSYAFDATGPQNEVVLGCADALARYGFCVVENVIPHDEIRALREEAEQAEIHVEGNARAVREAVKAGTPIERLVGREGYELRPVRRVGRPPKLVNDIVWLPRYAKHLAHPTLTAVAKRVLDDHLKIAQLHLRPIAANAPDGTPGGFGRAQFRGRKDTREWHTDWPHDLSAYGGGRADLNAGCIRQPFPDVAMCLVMIWYLTDVDEDSAGTFVVPGSHRDPRNPRGPDDDISVTSPIPGDMQVTAKAGSVFIQDSRCWHASAMHNNSGYKRVAIVNRWCPWWVSVDDYAPEGSFNTVCRPLDQSEFDTLPDTLKPYLRHVCPTEADSLQQPVLDRAQAAAERNQWGFRFLAEHPDEVAEGNKNIRVDIRAET